ncbi:MAG: hypothetical protein AAF298_07725 [Cyanobacteria bacterium P01_A01_bin.40]
MTGAKGTKIILTAMNSLMLLTIISSWIFKYIAYHPEMIIATTVNLIYI